ncbi:MAG: YtxH domain-containing protein [Bacteroidota bacterium]
MKQQEGGFSSFATGLFVGSVLGVGAALLYAPRRGARMFKPLPQESELRRPYDPPTPESAEKATEKKTVVKSSFGWRMMYYAASAVAMISDWRMKKRISKSND